MKRFGQTCQCRDRRRQRHRRGLRARTRWRRRSGRGGRPRHGKGAGRSPRNSAAAPMRSMSATNRASRPAPAAIERRMRAGRRARQQRRHHPGAGAAARSADDGLGRRRPRRPARHLCGLRRLCAEHDRAPARQHRQHRLDRRHALDAAARLAPAKAAVIAMTECLAAEWGPSAVRVNAVSPGYTRTPALKNAIERGERDVSALTGECGAAPAGGSRRNRPRGGVSGLRCGLRDDGCQRAGRLRLAGRHRRGAPMAACGRRTSSHAGGPAPFQIIRRRQGDRRCHARLSRMVR